jgi:hypothetical protein
MKHTDRYLLGIVAGIVILVVAAFAFVLTRSEPTYLWEDTPDGVVYDYLLALEKGDHERALSYLSTCIEDRPTDSRIFNTQIKNNWRFSNLKRDTSLQVLSSKIVGAEAVVVVRETTFENDAPFDNRADSDEFEMTLIQQDGAWKLVAGEKYWSYRWGRKPDCP